MGLILKINPSNKGETKMGKGQNNPKNDKKKPLKTLKEKKQAKRDKKNQGTVEETLKK
jgi:hypothetical protein